MIRVRFCSGSEYFLKIRFVFGSRSVNVDSGTVPFGFSSTELEICFPGSHLVNKYLNVVSLRKMPRLL